MAEAPYKVTDRRSSSGYVNSGGPGSTNTLIAAAVRTKDRQYVFPQDKDFHRNITHYGRKLLMSLGRWMFWNIPALQGAVLEQANLAVSTFIPQYYGANRAWGDAAEEWLYQWHKIFDVAGPPYDFDTWVYGLVISSIVDGDEGVLLTGTGDPSDPLKYPMIQRIPAHRIRSIEQSVEGGEFDGARLIDGVIVNDYGRAIGYRVYEDDPASGSFRDISARDMFLHFIPMFPGQLRGLSLLASGAFNWQDSAEYDRWEMLAQKACAAHTIIETNESGDTDTAKALIRNAATYDENNIRTAPDEQELGGGVYRYLRANSGSKLEAFHYDRPSPSAQSFQERKIRDAFRGTEWDVFFSLDPQSVGGAPMRVIVEKINRVLEKRRKAVGKSCTRVDGYGIAKAIKNRDLAEDVDWWKWEYQGPGDITADRKYDSDVDLQEVAQGFSSRKVAVARRGQYWEEVDTQREAEVRSDLARAKRLAQEFGITIMQAMVILRPPTPNQQLPTADQSQEPGGNGTTAEGAKKK